MAMTPDAPEAADSRADESLRLSGITKRFGSLVANSGIDLELRPGRSTACSERTVPASQR
ncbi:hypothetical protein GCM10027613_09210 [Microlunatus endophyticus]